MQRLQYMLRTIAACKDAVSKQASVISNFVNKANLKLNASKLEVQSISQQHKDPGILDLAGVEISTTSVAKCLGVWWHYNLSVSRAVQDNIGKARKTFFALGNIGAFHGNLNPLSARSMFETCIIPTLLYGCETWLLDVTTIKMLESFQCEIGCRILRVPKHHFKKVVRQGSQWPLVATRILICKPTFLAKLLANTNDIISNHIFTSLAIMDIYNAGIVQQCQMLESEQKY